MKGVDGKIRSGIWDNNRKISSGNKSKIQKKSIKHEEIIKLSFLLLILKNILTTQYEIIFIN